MMMTDEIEWGPWIDWPGGECPIPWAKAGEYQIKCGGKPVGDNSFDAADWSKDDDWWKHEAEYERHNITAYRVRARLMSRLSQPAAPAAPDVVDGETRRYSAAISDPRRMVIAFRAFRRVSARLYASETNCWAAMQVFGLGMTFASRWCKENNIDPDSTDPNATAALAAYAASKEAGR